VYSMVWLGACWHAYMSVRVCSGVCGVWCVVCGVWCGFCAWRTFQKHQVLFVGHEKAVIDR